ncbi:hypothetical protein [Planomonospora parontospora]|uniref:hypothetical protein n=1 Tax=Planomonospora parontospora TaxID=58119 RepID=UPI00166FAF41|nr:hypothetical protein [Planomonospora parontospora]GGL49737.1 hypothetical protein GCM10014719_58760 [Planomonospora parontospora subsp. antibiotica]GII19312.1 hypothetical protein Ppa05_60380 [Planomonospora parontospora subsp. antibiotica]
MTGDERADELATDGSVVVVSAVRRERRWITRADDHGIVVHGRTLRGLQASAQQALALRLGTHEVPPVQVRPQSAELDELAMARLRYDTALRHAVQTLRADGVSWADIAQACNVRVADAQAALGQGLDR